MEVTRPGRIRKIGYRQNRAVSIRQTAHNEGHFYPGASQIGGESVKAEGRIGRRRRGLVIELVDDRHNIGAGSNLSRTKRALREVRVLTGVHRPGAIISQVAGQGDGEGRSRQRGIGRENYINATG